MEIEITKITNQVKDHVSPAQLKTIRDGLELLKSVQSAGFYSGEEVHKNDLNLIGEEVGTRLKAARDKKGFSQEVLEKKSGISQSAISKIESGQKMVSVQEAKSLAKALGVTAQFLIAGE